MATSKPSKKDGNWPRLVADIGGTNARFALEVSPLELEHIETLPTRRIFCALHIRDVV